LKIQMCPGILENAFMKKTVIVWMTCLAASLLLADDQLNFVAVAAALKNVPAMELPITASAIIKAAKPSVRAVVVSNVVSIAVGINPAAAPLIVSAVAQAAPETVAVAVEAAVFEQPAQASKIARAAVAIVPARAAEIVLAASRAAPREYKEVAITAARLAPAAARDILKAVSSFKPELKTYIDMEIAGTPQEIPSVRWCLEQAEASAIANRAGPGRVGPLPENLPRGTTSKPTHGDDNPPGGRNYARP
jgi:hypothetical protein